MYIIKGANILLIDNKIIINIKEIIYKINNTIIDIFLEMSPTTTNKYIKQNKFIYIKFIIKKIIKI